MRIQHYDTHPGSLTITVSTPRDGAAPSLQFTAATIHEDYVARVRALLREYLHCGPTAEATPAAARLQAYLPAVAGRPLYALRTLQPAGAPRDVDNEFFLEVMRIRYEFVLVDLPPAVQADSIFAEARERHMEFAVRSLFQANSLPDVFIPADTQQRNPNQSDIDIVCEFGAVTSKRGFDL